MWTGSAWEYYWQSRKVIRPKLSDFTVLAEDATVTDSGGILITGAFNKSSIRLRSLPAASNYFIEAGFEYAIGNENYTTVGVIMRSAADTRITSEFQYNASGFFIHLEKQNAGGGYNSAYQLTSAATRGFGDTSTGVIFFRMEDDGTTRWYYMSRNGKHWTRIQNVGRADFLTPVSAGFIVMSSPASPPSARLFHWLQQ